MRRRIVMPALAAVALAAGCGKETGPTAGSLLVSLVTPSADDGAIRLTLHGGRMGTITAADPEYRIFVARPDSTSARVIITGPVSAGPLLHIAVPDAGLVASYGATVNEAAERTTFAAKSLVGYGVAITDE
jgi:hypothetical protein